MALRRKEIDVQTKESSREVNRKSSYRNRGIQLLRMDLQLQQIGWFL